MIASFVPFSHGLSSLDNFFSSNLPFIKNAEDSILFHPVLPVGLLLVMAGLCLLLGLYGLWRSIRGTIWRAMAGLVLLLWLAQPQILHPTWQTEPQDVLLLLDHSPSTLIQNRRTLIDQAADALEQKADMLPNVHIHRSEIGGGHGEGTRLFDAIAQQAPDYAHLSAVFLLTDGMNHDTPPTLPPGLFLRGKSGQHPVPLHLLLGAAHEETDRSLRVLSAPPYVIVGQKAHIRIEVNDRGLPQGTVPQDITIMARKNDGSTNIVAHTVSGKPVELDIPVTQPGVNLKELYATPLPGEASLQNNRVVLHLQGVRDRLKVLLVSGIPNQSTRIWRQLLKADPSVDLVHFTILRSPETNDDTPLSDLALIPFPTHELFEEKIRSFDLIILDGFRNQSILPDSYLRNIADYVKKGGGLLVVAGPEMVQDGSLQNTPLADILPAHIPLNSNNSANNASGLAEGRFIPRLTETGLRHPVTATLQLSEKNPAEQQGKPPLWGPWYRALVPDHVQGQTLLTGPHNHPLLVLNHEEEGRVAMLLSDQIWLWSRGGNVPPGSGSGPQAELLRRLAHWLMKEPDLEENRLEARIVNHALIVERLGNTGDPLQKGGHQVNHEQKAEIITPQHRHLALSLMPQGERGILRGTLPLSAQEEEGGIWTIKQGILTAFASPPMNNPIEMRDLRSTATQLAPIIEQSGGGIFWLGRTGTPDLRQIIPSEPAFGPASNPVSGPHTSSHGWAGLPQQQTAIPGKDHVSNLLPGWLALTITLALLALGWRKEGRT